MRRRTGWTLTEIVCSIAVVTILAAILFPVIAQARETSRLATGMSSARSLHTTMNLYAADYDANVAEGLAPLATGCLQDDTNWASVDGGCKDLRTGLVWSRTSDEMTGYYNRVYKRPPGDTRLPGAWDYCHALAEGSCPNEPDGLCHGWRLPTKDESVLAASHQIKNYAPMVYPDTFARAADPSWVETKGKYKGYSYCYTGFLGTGVFKASVWQNANGTLYSVGDTICVRTP